MVFLPYTYLNSRHHPCTPEILNTKNKTQQSTTNVSQEVAQESLRAAHEQRLALEETLERRGREAAALHQHNCALRLAANNALQELQVSLN